MQEISRTLDQCSAVGAGAQVRPAGILCPTNVPAGKIVGAGDFQTTCEFALEGVQQSNAQLKNVTSTNWTTGRRTLWQILTSIAIGTYYSGTDFDRGARS